MIEPVTAERVKNQMAVLLKQSMATLPDERVLTELVAQSFALVEMVIELQDTFDVRLVQDDLKTVRTVGDLAQLIASRVDL